MEEQMQQQTGQAAQPEAGGTRGEAETRQPPQAPSAGGEVRDPEPGGGRAGEEETFQLKYMDEIRKVGRREAIALAQKGLDYDRIRAQRDALRAQLGQPGAGESRQEARRRESRAFLEAYPQVKPEEIPQEVWARVARGEPLTWAYSRHRAQMLEQALEAKRQQEENQKRALGSLARSAPEQVGDWISRWWSE